MPEVPAASEGGAPTRASGSAASQQPRSDYVLMENCLVSLIDDLEMTAQEDGLLLSLEGREGMDVRKDLQLAQIDDREAKAKQMAAEAALARAKEEAANDVNLRFAQASEKVAEAEYNQAIDANQRVSGAIAPSEVRRRKLAWEKATLAIEQARVEQTLIGREKEIKAAELEQARLAVERRKVVCPWGGQIVAVKKRTGAWLTRGEPLLRLVRMDRLRVAGHVNAAHYGPQEVSGRPVSIRVTLERGRTERFTGKITFVHPEQSGNEYLVWAEVDNRMQADQWVLRPGLHVDMAIHLAGPDGRQARK
jgi:multidrug resistance efflux pump